VIVATGACGRNGSRCSPAAGLEVFDPVIEPNQPQRRASGDRPVYRITAQPLPLTSSLHLAGTLMFMASPPPIRQCQPLIILRPLRPWYDRLWMK
jgi:hypothetical protein